MYSIQLFNKIAKCGTDIFGRAYAVSEQEQNPDAIMVRSASMHEVEFGDNLKAIARAGAGVNNIPVEKCAEAGIVVFNTPGANANAVKELVLAGLFLSSRNVIGGVAWAKTLQDNPEVPDIAKAVEKGKSSFAGPELRGKTLGVIGLGAIGALVANAAVALDMEVIGYDPHITVEAAWRLSRAVKRAQSPEEIYKACDYITIHVPFLPATKDMIDKAAIAQMKDGVRILNFSRAGLVNDAAIKEALLSKKVACYVVDFPTEETIGVEGIIAIPHLGASTPESEDNCAIMAAHELIDFLEQGNIKNSVNYPDVYMPRNGDVRLCVMHRNIPNTISKISQAVSDAQINIENMTNRSKKEYAYTMVEIIGELPESVVTKVNAIDGVIRTRVIR